jgi:hypothetical protein
MNEDTLVNPSEDVVAPLREPRDVPVLVSLGDENVPVCEDGSCSL